MISRAANTTGKLLFGSRALNIFKRSQQPSARTSRPNQLFQKCFVFRNTIEDIGLIQLPKEDSADFR